jgi:5-methylcytosine-specific restriction endonuclease McrA
VSSKTPSLVYDLDFWAQCHSDALHPGDRSTCDHCREMISCFGPMPEMATIQGRIRELDREHSARRSSKIPIPATLRWEVWERDNFTCVKCGARRFLHVDHIHPESRGGETCVENLQTLCQSCNCSKGARIQ